MLGKYRYLFLTLKYQTMAIATQMTQKSKQEGVQNGRPSSRERIQDDAQLQPTNHQGANRSIDLINRPAELEVYPLSRLSFGSVSLSHFSNLLHLSISLSVSSTPSC